MQIFCRKILRYDPTCDGLYGKYDGYKKIAAGEIDPDIEKEQDHELSIPQNISYPVFVSSSKRGVSTAKKYFDSSKITLLNQLKEISFDLGALLSKEEYEKKGSNLVRERFIQAFIDDNLIENREEIKTRILFVQNILSHLEEDNYLVISHSFFLKILQVYLKDKNLFEDPSLLKKHFVTTKRTFDFGEGFEFFI